MKKLSIITFFIIIGILASLMIFFRYPKHYSIYAGLTSEEKMSEIKKEKVTMIRHEYGSDYKCIRSAEGVRVYSYIFHYVIPDKFVDPNNKIEYGNSLSPEFFEKVLRALFKNRDEKKIEIVNLYELDDMAKRDCYPSADMVILTSDDGWDDNYNYLFPLTKKYSMPFNLALISSKISKTSSEINNFTNEYEIKEMLESGYITIASHTMSHLDLRKLSPDRVEKEVCQSKKDLENLFGVRINTIVYPSGKYDDNTIRAVKSCGYTFGFTTLNKSFFSEDLKNKPFELARIRVNRNSDLNVIFNFGNRVEMTANKTAPPPQALVATAQKPVATTIKKSSLSKKKQ